MKKRNQKQEKRIKKMILSTGLFAVLLVASTYAWFIGMQSVSVTAFDVKIAGIDGLALSLDGVKFTEEVTINQTTYDLKSTYASHQNVWGELIPMSSVGVVDNSKSKLQLFEKGSLTATPGGYRILASEVTNSADKEAEGYVAFDLFIKNLSGEEYYPDNNVLNEEAIYLTTDSEVKVAASGKANTGIENSVRVAFAQIARVEATEDTPATLQALNCASSGDATAICGQRKATIWEPNDTKHAANAINWYTKACKARTGATVTDEKSYSGACAEVKNGTANKTYAIKAEIKNNFNVDVYDGTDYNGYTGSSEYLQEMDYFTDTEKMYRGDARPAFMTLAPNSITKVKVYVYIEGQDVDNYDFAQLGSAIAVNFGFTKERFTDKDVNYSDKDTATLPDDVIQKN